MHWLNSCAGFLVGLLVGFTGVGGGALMTPLLVLVFGVAPLTKTAGGWIHGIRGAVDWLVLRRLWLGSLPMAVMTLIWLHNSPESNGLAKLIIPLLAVALVLTGIAMLARPVFQRIGERLRTDFPGRFKAFQPALTVFAGALLGFLYLLAT